MSLWVAKTLWMKTAGAYTIAPPPFIEGRTVIRIFRLRHKTDQDLFFPFLKTQKEHSVSLYSLSVTTAKPLVYSIFGNRHNYLMVKYKLNYARARTVALRSVGRCGNAAGYVEITIGFHNMRDTHIDTSAKSFCAEIRVILLYFKWA